MNKIVLAVVVLLAIVAVVVIARRRSGPDKAVCDLQLRMRKLWYDHVARTRLFLKSSLNNLPDFGTNVQWLMANQSDIGNAIAVALGGQKDSAPAQTLINLLKEHISLAAQITEQAKAGQPIDNLNAQWEKNADDIARFLTGAGLGNFADLSAMMRSHLALTAGSLRLQLAKRWQEDVVQFDKIVAQAMQMADMLSAGLLSKRRVA